MRRGAAAALFVLGALVAAGETRAGDGAPSAPAASATIPMRFVRARPTLESLKTGESGRIAAGDVHVQSDGSAWLRLTAGPAPERCDPAVSPKLTKTADGVFDVDLTGCDCRWATGNEDGT